MTKIKGIPEAIGIAAACLGLLSYCTPASAHEGDDYREREERYERRERERDFDRDLDRLYWRLEAERDREHYRDRTICQPGEDCRRTLWRREYRYWR